MRQLSHLKMLVSGSRRRAMRPRDRSGSSRFSYGYLRVTGRGRMRCSSVRTRPSTTPRPHLTGPTPSRACSPIHFPEHDVDRAEDRDDVGDETALQQPREDLQVVERRAAHLRAERVRAAAVADHVDADLTLARLDRVVGLALRALPDVAQARADRTAGHVGDALADDRDGVAHLLEPDLVARELVALRVDRGLHALQFRVDGVRPIDAEVPVDAGSAKHRTGEAIRLRDGRWDRPDPDGALEKDL